MPSTTKGTTVTRNRSLTFLAGAAVIPLAALAVAGCGSASGGSAAVPAPKTASGQAAAVGIATTRLGRTLIDSKGRTLYLFKKDPATTSTCAGACASDWPPLRTNSKPTAGRGLNPALVATTGRSDGAPQVTYNGHPLYLYEGDEKPGDTDGQGVTAFGAPWYALAPAGNQVSVRPSNSTGDNSNDGGGRMSRPKRPYGIGY
jgi:predicted lipoprotein with Yx(FWY)xxD motif